MVFAFNWGLLPPANEVCEGYVFTPVCQAFCSQGGGRAWWVGVHAWGVGGMHGRSGVHGRGWGACMVLRHVWQGGGGHAWQCGVGMRGRGGACMAGGCA